MPSATSTGRVLAFRRDLIVDAPRARAWHHFARAAEWPSWHTDLKSVQVSPAGELGPQSTATLNPHKGRPLTFRMVEFAPYDHWAWVSNALWFTIWYDHRFEAVDERTTRITLHMDVGGFGRSLFARLVAAAATKNLEKDLPLLAKEIAAANTTQSPHA